MLQVKELKRLLPSHREKIHALEEACRKTDGTKGSINLSCELNYRRELPSFFLVYAKTSDCFPDGKPSVSKEGGACAPTAEPLMQQTLVGFLSAFLPDEKTAELQVLVHPSYRRQGIFTELVSRVKRCYSPFGTHKFLFVCEPDCVSASAAMQAMHAEKVSSEYQMSLFSAKKVFSAKIGISDVSPAPFAFLRKAVASDLPTIGHMNALFFDSDDATGLLWAEESFRSKNVTEYLYLLQKEKTVPIGTVCLYEEASSATIFGLGILPEYRSLGFGKSLLYELLSLIDSEKKVYLQVSSRNEAAFHLYQKAGFQITSGQDFWKLPI